MAATARQKIGWGSADALVIAWALFPVWWIVAVAFQAPAAISNWEDFWPTHWTWANFSGIFKTSDFTRALVNSIVVAVIATAVAVVVGSVAAYAIARLRFPGKGALVGTSLLIAMFPQISLVTPLFNITRYLGLFDTWWALIIPDIAFALPMSIFILSSFFREIPWELEKAAKVDGATPMQAFLRVVAPLAAPGMVTTAILVFINVWNEFLFAISLTATNNARTVPAAIAFFTGSSQFQQPAGSIAAAAVIITIPIVVFVLFFQRRIVAGLTSGAVKG